MTSAHDFSFPGLSGGTVTLKDYKGRAVLVVNTASACGLTPQYAGLQSLYEARSPEGLTIVGVPSNDFGAQEPGSESEVATFCQRNYGVTFPMTAKQTVLGPTAHPFYRWAVAELGEGAAPRWNFHKYLVGKDGALAGVFGSRTPPDAADLAAAITDALRA